MSVLSEFITLVHSSVDLQSAFQLWCPPVPEIDGPAGVAALALLVSVGIVSYNRARG